MDFLISFISNLIQVVQGNLVVVFVGVIGAVLLIKVTSNVIKTIISILIMLIFVKICLDMGIIYFPMPI